MFLVGLTGGIATGKSTVSKLLSEAGVEVIDADLIARQIVEPGKKAWKGIRREFGSRVFHDDGTLDREKLGQIIFSSRDERVRLDAITHPEIAKCILWRLLLCLLSWRQFVVLDVPLLFSASAGAFARKFLLYRVVVVSCDAETQRRRLMARDGLTAIEAGRRMEAQMALRDQEALADVVLWNDGTEEEVKERVDRLLTSLKESRAHWRLRTLCVGLVGAAIGLSSLAVRRFFSLTH